MDLPKWGSLPQNLKKDKFYCVYTKKIEYADGEFGKVLMGHNFVTGEEFLICSADKQVTNKSIAINEFCDKYCGYRYIGDEVSRILSGREAICEERFNYKKIQIGKTVSHMTIDTLENDSCILIRFFQFHCSMPKIAEKKTYEEYKRVLIKDGIIWSEFPSKPNEKFFWEKKHYKAGLQSLLYCGQKHSSYQTGNITTAFRKNFPNILIFPKYYGWLSYYPATPHNDAFHKQVSKYNDLVGDAPADLYEQVRDVVSCPDSFLCRWQYSQTDIMPVKIGCCEKLNKELSVIRMFYKFEKEFCEYARLFIDKENVYPCYYYNGVVSRCESLSDEFWNSDVPFQVALSHTIIGKKYPYLIKLKQKDTALRLLMSHKFLYMEQMEKLGFSAYVKFLYKNYNLKGIRSQLNKYYNGEKRYVDISVNDCFSSVILKRLILFKKYICNEEILNDFLQLFTICGTEYYSFYKEMATCLNVKNFHTVFSYFIHIIEPLGNIDNLLSKKENFNIIKRLWSMCLDFFNQNNTETNSGFKCTTLFYDMRDIMRMMTNVYEERNDLYKALVDFTSMRNSQNISELHDRLVKLQHFKKYSPERYGKICDKYREREFEDDNFIVRLPTTTDEIIQEGSRMNHCVGGYVDYVMSGRSVIMLLRRKSDVNKEYVTIELNQKGEFLQAKCKNNYTLTSASTLSFLEKWIQEKHLIPKTYDFIYKQGRCLPAGNINRYFIEKDSIVDKQGKMKKI